MPDAVEEGNRSSPKRKFPSRGPGQALLILAASVQVLGFVAGSSQFARGSDAIVGERNSSGTAGAFTGPTRGASSVSSRRGGTLFLDEIGDLQLA